MKCLNCGQDNKDAAKTCKKCARDLSVPPAWFPDAAWHMKTLGTIYGILIFLFLGVSFALKRLPKPYHIRQISPEMTPWLRRPGLPQHLSEEQLKSPERPEDKKVEKE
jgi:hypothetical protein